MLDAIKHGLSHVVTFTGRDARQAFWYYVLFVYLLTTAINMVFVMPMTMQNVMMGVQQGIAQGQGQDPEATQAAVRAAMFGSMSDMMPKIVLLGMVIGIAMLLLLGAAFVRRLHDTNLSGLWALVPAGCQAASLLSMPGQLARMQEAMRTTDLNNPMAGLMMMRGWLGAGQLRWACASQRRGPTGSARPRLSPEPAYLLRAISAL